MLKNNIDNLVGTKTKSSYKINAFVLLIFLYFCSSFAFSQTTLDFDLSKTEGCAPFTLKITNTSNIDYTKAIISWDLGNGNTSTLPKDVKAIYNLPGTYKITLTVEQDGVKSTVSKSIQAYEAPKVDFEADVKSGCIPLSVNFKDLSTSQNTIIQWLWNFGDGMGSIDRNPHTVYKSNSVNNVTLFAIDNKGCTALKVKDNYIVSTDKPVIDINYSDTKACALPIDVKFSGVFASNNVNTLWDFGNGKTSNVKSPTFNYDKVGKYTVSLTAENEYSCKNTITKDIEIEADHFVDIQSNSISGCVPFNYTFDINSDLVLTSYQWAIGTYTSNEKSGKYIFTQPGEYTVKLHAVGVNGCQINQTQKVQVFEKPNAGFTYDKEGACLPPVNINFKSESKGTIIHDWSFGNKIPNSNSENPSILLTEKGIYKVRHIVTNEYGCKDTLQIDTAIIVGSPIVNIIASKNGGCAPYTTELSLYKKGVGDITDIDWTFPDGSQYHGLNPPDFRVVDKGVGYINAHIEFDGACPSVDIFTEIKAGELKKFDTQFNPNEVCVQDGVSGKIINPQNDTKYTWYFGDGGKMQGENVSYQYEDIGVFTVYVVPDNNGCKDSINITNVKVNEPKAIFSSKKGCDSKEFQFNNRSIGSTNSTWDFGDGATLNSNDASITHTYDKTGTYKVKLYVENSITHCKDSVSQTIEITETTPPITMKKQNVCTPFLLQLQLSPDIYSKANWDLGNNIVDGLAIEQQYNDPGVYTISLTATKKDGCIETYLFEKVLNVTSVIADFDFTPVGGCAPIQVQFNDSSTAQASTIKSMAWDLGGMMTTDEKNPSYTFLQNKDAKIVLTVTNNFNCVDSMVKTIPIFQPKAHFITKFNTICTDTEMDFIDSSKAVAPTYYWEFSDGDTSTKQHPKKVFNQEGNYSVKLTVTDANNCKDSVEASSYIKVENIHYDFDAAPRFKSCPPLTTNFEVIPKNIEYNNLQWDFGDFNKSLDTNKTPVNIYSKSGIFDVALYLEDYRGCKDTIVKNEFVTVKGPRGDFNFSPQSGCYPLDVTFTPEVYETYYISWDFGDGTVIIDTNVNKEFEYIYTQPTLAIPKVLIEDKDGCKVQIQNDSVKIYGTDVELLSNKVGLCDQDEITFADISTYNPIDHIISRQWKFDNDIVSTDSAFTQTFTVDKNDTITTYLSIKSAHGCEDIDSAQFIVYKPPTLIRPPQYTICKYDSIILNVQGAEHIEWSSPRYALSPDESHPKVAPLVDTWFKILAYDTIACSSEDSLLVKVVDIFSAHAAPDTVICEGGSVLLRSNVSEINSGEFIYNWYLNNKVVSKADSFWVTPTQSGTYILNVQNGACKERNLPVFIEVSSLPDIYVYQDTVIAKGQSVTISASSNQNLYYTWTPDYNISCTNCPSPTVFPYLPTEYKVIGINQYGCMAEREVMIDVLDLCSSSEIKIPNVFTPNNDGLNDTFRPVFDSDYVKFKHLRIYNRFGEMIFETENPKTAWDGTYNNTYVNTGVYVYYLEYDCYDGNSNMLKGNVTLLR
ncbi:MAG: PKD domain-containing protein [Chitinophagales bacterium]|nr:PKD domain-containing protein [Chitinophagales bacterium]